MNRLQEASALKTGFRESPGGDLSHPTQHFLETAYHRADSSGYIWSLIVTGCLFAAMVTTLSSRLPESHTLSWSAILIRSIKYIALAAAGGAVGTSIPWFFLKPKPSFSLAFLSKIAAVGWIFFPCIILFYRRQSPWMFLVIALATVASAFSLRRLLPAGNEPDRTKPPAGYTSELPSLFGLPIENFRPVRAFFIALCAQAALLLAIWDHPFSAGLLLSTCLSLLVWRWSAFDTSTFKHFAGNKQSLLFFAFALIFTVLALVPWISPRDRGLQASDAALHDPSLAARRPIVRDQPGAEYVGVILWPPPLKKTQITPPTSHIPSLTVGGASKPIVIPFDGPYWYFKAPSQRPGLHAHVAHGKATDVSVSSTDSAPLLMEAHQNLGSSIDLACCREIDIAITNADNRPGKIALGLRLTDSSSIQKSYKDLGLHTIASSESLEIPLNRPPVIETLRFPIPASATFRRFDAITIFFVPSRERARRGAKVSIQNFTLLPR